MRAFLLVLALAASTASASTHPMLGTWTGQLPNEPEHIVLELTFHHIDEAGLAHGMLCHAWRYLGTFRLWDLGPGPDTAATPEIVNTKGTVAKFGFYNVTYDLFVTGSHTLGLHLTVDGRRYKLTLKRTAPSDAPCISRMRTRPPPG